MTGAVTLPAGIAQPHSLQLRSPQAPCVVHPLACAGGYGRVRPAHKCIFSQNKVTELSTPRGGGQMKEPKHQEPSRPKPDLKQAPPPCMDGWMGPAVLATVALQVGARSVRRLNFLPCSGPLHRSGAAACAGWHRLSAARAHPLPTHPEPLNHPAGLSSPKPAVCQVQLHSDRVCVPMLACGKFM